MLEFHVLYETYASDVYRFSYWLAGNRMEAEDITSETFVRAWARLETIRTETLKAYLLTIARNVFLEQLRKQRHQHSLDDFLPDPTPSPEKLVEDRADLAYTYRILQTLPEVDRAALLLRIQQDLSYDEIARALQLSTAAAKVKVHRARLKLLAAQLDKEVP